MEPSSDNHVAIRRMELADIDAVKRIDDLSFTLPWPRKAFLYELQKNKTSRYYVAEARGPAVRRRVVGMIGMWLIIDEIHISTLAVHPDHRRQGIAERLIDAALTQAHKDGAVSATLEVRDSNLAAQSLYNKFGFEVTGRRKRYYRDNFEDAVLMAITNLDKIEVPENSRL